MKNTLLRLIPLLALGFISLHAAEDPRTEKLRAADDARVAAVLAGDTKQLATIYTDDLRYGHGSGAVDNKASYLDALTSGRVKYLSWNYEERNFSFPAPGVAVMTGRTRVEVGRPDGTMKMELSYLSVWREEDGKWRFMSWQSAKIPEPAPTAK